MSTPEILFSLVCWVLSLGYILLSKPDRVAWERHVDLVAVLFIVFSPIVVPVLIICACACMLADLGAWLWRRFAR